MGSAGIALTRTRWSLQHEDASHQRQQGWSRWVLDKVYARCEGIGRVWHLAAPPQSKGYLSVVARKLPSLEIAREVRIAQ